MQNNTKRRCIPQTPLVIIGISRRLIASINNQITDTNLKSNSQFLENCWSSYVTALFNVGYSGCRNFRLFRKLVNSHGAFQSPVFQSYFQVYIVGIHCIPLIWVLVVSLCPILEQNRYEIKTLSIFLFVCFSLTLYSLSTYLDNPLVIGYNLR